MRWRITGLTWTPVHQPRPGYLLQLTDDEGHVGLGEATPLPGYGQPQLVTNFAYETAVADIEGQRRGCSLAELLAGGPAAQRVPVNGLVTGDEDPPAGYATLKVKVGREAVDDDVNRVARIRSAVGPDVALRLDANGAWSAEDALAALDRLATYDIAYVEEPVAGMDALVELAERSPIPVAADESLRTATDVERLPFVVLKPALLGLERTVRWAARAQAAGTGVAVTSLLEGVVGVTAALHAAAAIPGVGACGLSISEVPQGPGLGACPS